MEKQDLTKRKYFKTIHGILEKSKFCKDMTIAYDSRLRERRYGVAEGKPLSELRAMAKAEGKECPVFTPPGGETLDQVKMRGKDFFDFLCQLILKEAGQKEPLSPEVPGNCLESSLAEIFPLGNNCSPESHVAYGHAGLAASVLVVSHGAYMRSLFGYFLTDLKGSLPATLNRSELAAVSPNTGISLFIIDFEEGGEPEVHCVCMNLRDHLNGGN
ncbi:fructose-2,6-bisphosphatase TIGAR isoform X3 [Octodon degus]|uniref:Fructose-2,6-bisphosphatase TIGAR isoform X3 n=1 Tax=Octodon degus TaxID=10160 RepID=A0A6P6DHM9_OCTDE|nr:fructose-2,6-bisphosphatase TIGAR isoform X3 [Octodon degus]